MELTWSAANPFESFKIENLPDGAMPMASAARPCGAAAGVALRLAAAATASGLELLQPRNQLKPSVPWTRNAPPAPAASQTPFCASKAIPSRGVRMPGNWKRMKSARPAAWELAGMPYRAPPAKSR